jgi:hypothetical protein
MQAEIAVSVEFAIMPKYADFVVADKHDPAVAVLEFGKFRHKFLGHKRHTLGFRPVRPIGFRLLFVGA